MADHCWDHYCYIIGTIVVTSFGITTGTSIWTTAGAITVAPLRRDDCWDHDWDHYLGPLFGITVGTTIGTTMSRLLFPWFWGAFHNGPLFVLQLAHRETMDQCFLQWTIRVPWTSHFGNGPLVCDGSLFVAMDH